MNFREFARMINDQMEATVLLNHLAILYLLEHPGTHCIGDKELAKTEAYVIGFTDEYDHMTAQLMKPDVKTFGEAPLKLLPKEVHTDVE